MSDVTAAGRDVVPLRTAHPIQELELENPSYAVDPSKRGHQRNKAGLGCEPVKVLERVPRHDCAVGTPSRLAAGPAARARPHCLPSSPMISTGTVASPAAIAPRVRRWPNRAYGTTSTFNIIPLSSWARMWQWMGYLPRKLRNRILMTTSPRVGS